MSLTSQTYLGHNQEAYQELRLALQLNLRRQLLLAVCDDAALQEQLAQRLEVHFAPLPDTVPLAPEVRSRQLTLATLRLSGDRPDLVREVLRWLKQQQRLRGTVPTTPVFQIVGIDQLTRQSPTVQNRFLASLIRVDALLTQLDCRLVVWVPRPWLGKIRQSVPGFWRSRSGLFEFVGDPAPVVPAGQGPSAPSAGPYHAAAPRLTQAAPTQDAPAQPELWRVLRDDLSTFEQTAPSAAEVTSPSAAPPAPTAPAPPPAATERPPLLDLPTLLGTANAPDASKPSANAAGTALRPGEFASVAMPPVGATAAETLAALQASLPMLPDLEQSSASALSTDRPFSQTLQLPVDLAEDAALANLWHYIQQLADQQAGPLTLSRAYLTLGQMVRDRAVVNAPTANALGFAAAVYDRALVGLPEGGTDWCDALNDLASLYWLQGQQGDMAAAAPWLKRSIETYEKAVKGSQKTIPADTLGRIYGNLGTVYGLLANLDDPVLCLEQAVAAYQRAIEQCPAAQAPLDYANLQNSLGAIHWRLSQYADAASPGENRAQYHLTQAVTAYDAALQHRTAEAAPLEYAMVQNNLGIAYWSLAQHQQPVVLLERAIAAYRSALTYRTLDVAPAGCAATANNLGTAYWDLAQQVALTSEHRIDALQQAIEAYEAALSAAEIALQAPSSPDLGFDLWATCHSAGVVHDQLAQALPADQAETRQRHLQAALQHYLLAYRGWRDSPPQLEVLITALVYNAHLNFEIFGTAGQQTVLSKLPGELLPEVLRRL
ncbi:tetratricopeptide repeat protein [Nodosilinea sp. LEGE 07088]|uniref:tetratricopeptide repeat protein n=1 Tax=Nodosilinea sp. LEGE 07088 TaxID=2777968 RepID=UPI0018822125|nr:tetratricopeptide repeat protein [Nodosilinea sp. LEGE 07088]MBE9137620.1 tetratricopeptide repeat protein [Nodosilinea sp. LEGE 07088]